MISRAPERFDWDEEIGPYLNELEKKGIPLQHVRESTAHVTKLDEFQRIIREMLSSVVFPSLTESGEAILKEGMLRLFYDQE